MQVEHNPTMAEAEAKALDISHRQQTAEEEVFNFVAHARSYVSSPFPGQEAHADTSPYLAIHLSTLLRHMRHTPASVQNTPMFYDALFPNWAM